MTAAPWPQASGRALVFEPNRGQAPAPVKWLARAPGYTLFITSEGVTMVLEDPAANSAPAQRGFAPVSFRNPAAGRPSAPAHGGIVRMKLTGSQPWDAITGLEPTGGVSNYFIGNDREQWKTDIPHFARLNVAGIYNGIDMVFYSHGSDLEYDFVVAPGADPKQIRLVFEGVDGRRVDGKSGDLILTTSGGSEIRHVRPKVYEQAANHKNIEVAGAYEILNGGQATFALANYNRQHSLVIDPTVSFTRFLAGSEMDQAYAIAVDTAGNAYVAGWTHSQDFPLVGSTQTPSDYDAFVTKLSSNGQILFSTYMGGSGRDGASAIALDSTGVYIAGVASSPNFPALYHFGANTPQTGTQYFSGDVFVTKMALTGNTLIYSLLLGGSLPDFASAIAVDASGAAFVAGSTYSTDFPTVGKWESKMGASNGLACWLIGDPSIREDAFIAKISPSGAFLESSVYLGGSGDDWISGVAVDHTGNPWITGGTCSNNFPYVGPTSIIPDHQYAFVARLTNNLDGLMFSRPLALNGPTGDCGDREF
jgi:hypothetical protein